MIELKEAVLSDAKLIQWMQQITFAEHLAKYQDFETNPVMQRCITENSEESPQSVDPL